MEPVLQSIHYDRSAISHSADSGAVLYQHLGILFNEDMEPQGDFYLKNNLAKILRWYRESLR